MDSTLVNGLEDVSFGGRGDDQQVGQTAASVNAAVDSLTQCADSVTTYISQLTAQGDNILQGWDGETAYAFRHAFPGLIDAFSAIPGSVRSIADWASSTSTAYTNLDQETAQAVTQILGGAK